LLRGELRPELTDELALGRKFSNLLRPLRGAVPQRGFDARRHPALGFDAAAGAAVRDAADGVVVYSGQELGQGHAVLVLHRGGWLTLYAGVERDGAAESGTRVLRGEWIGRVAAPEPGRSGRLRFEWIVDGRPADASAALFGE
jgi:murein DD-endopeptidase MepM/ murein hydrolase activator NlpD